MSTFELPLSEQAPVIAREPVARSTAWLRAARQAKLLAVFVGGEC